MPKVLRIINRFNLGGPTYNVSYLTKYLNHGYETLLVGGIPESDETDSLHILDNLHIKPKILNDLKRTPNFKNDYKSYTEIKKLIETYKPDIVHTHASKAGALGRLAASQMKVPVIVHTYHGHVFNGYFGSFKTFVYKRIEKFLARKSDGIVAISPIQKFDLASVHKICAEDKIRIIPLGFDLERFQQNKAEKRAKTRANFGVGEEDIAIGIIGRLAPIKNHQLFIESIYLAAQKTDKNLKIFIVGDGSEREYIQQLSDSLADFSHVKVLFTSWIIDIENFNPAMDIICLTSINEGTPVSLIEAQAAGVPVVSTDVGGVKDVMLDGVTGFIVPELTAEAFSEKLLILIEDKEKRQKMSQNGWDFVKDKFHYNCLVQNMEAYYDELLKNKGIQRS